MRIIYYYQTLTDLSSILIENTPVTHLILSSFHFGKNNDNSPYIHLNNFPPNDSKFNKVWSQLKDAKEKYNIEVHIMLGGAGGAFNVLFSDFDTYYKMLFNTLIAYDSIVTGINLDIEESTTLSNTQMLIKCLKRDFGSNFKITMAPVQSSLQSNIPGMAGFCYKDLYCSSEGKMIDYFNGQFYYELSFDAYKQCIVNGYPSEKIVLGMIAGQDISGALQVVKQINNVYPNFGGVFMWEYFNAPPNGTKNPETWACLMKKAIENNSTDKKNITDTTNTNFLYNMFLKLLNYTTHFRIE